MTISRLDLDGAGSPTALVTRIFQTDPKLTIPIPLEQLCRDLDIESIGILETEGFEAALITDELKSTGGILVATGRSRQRRRFSIAHELGHFLIPAHLPRAGEASLCSAEQFQLTDVKAEDRRRRIEAEANRFAALLLMPPPMLRAELQKIRQPAVSDIVQLAALFDVSKDAMARAYADYSREAVGIVVVQQGRIRRAYRKEGHLPPLAVPYGSSVPFESVYWSANWIPGQASDPEQCDPNLWLRDADVGSVETLQEQVLGQSNGYALIMLLAELADEDDEATAPRW